MGDTDHRPLRDTPGTAVIAARHNNRLGAVYSSLLAFWNARHVTLGIGATRRDAYSVLMFDRIVRTCIENDFASTPDGLLQSIIPFSVGRGTNYDSALNATQAVMEQNWSDERFGICNLSMVRPL